LWRGPALAPVTYAEFAQPEIRHLEELRLAALEARVESELRLGDHGTVIGELEGFVAPIPAASGWSAQLMLALYRCGRQGDALEVYARTRAHLPSELGLEPGPALRALQGEILTQSAALQRVSAGPGSAAAAAASERAGELPSGVVTVLLTDIEGSTRLRETDADAMAAALKSHDGLIAALVRRYGGRLLQDKDEGGTTLSVFQRVSDAVSCATELRRALLTAWPTGLEPRLCVALHSGEAQEHDGDHSVPC
jgi:hypothetical protein